MKTPRMSDVTRQRRTERARRLADRFERNPRIERLAFQDERGFPLEVPLNPQNDRVYFKGDKKHVPVKNYQTIKPSAEKGYGVRLFDMLWSHSTVFRK